MSLILLQKTFSLRKPKVAIFADVIKTANIFIKKTFKDSKKVKKIRNHVLKSDVYLYFLI